MVESSKCVYLQTFEAALFLEEVMDIETTRLNTANGAKISSSFLEYIQFIHAQIISLLQK